MADIIAESAMRDRSFAGPYAYSSSLPFKVLAGEEKSVPVQYIVEALDEIQSGLAQPQQVVDMRKKIEPGNGSCVSKCGDQFFQCLGTRDVASVKDTDKFKTCTAQVVKSCLPSCKMT
jgi:hypothetical protein